MDIEKISGQWEEQFTYSLKSGPKTTFRMNFYTFLIAFVLVVIFAILLPIVSGIGTFKVEKQQRGSTNAHLKDKRGVKFELSSKTESFGTASSTNRKERNFDIDSRTGLKKRVIGKYDEDPNTYDYDVNEFINEDAEEEKRAQVERLQKFDGSKEKAYEELV